MPEPRKRQTLTDRLNDEMPPANLDMEREVLGYLVGAAGDEANVPYIGIAFSFLKPGDFHAEQHQELFKQLRDAWHASVSFTEGSILQWLKDRGVLVFVETGKVPPGKVSAADLAVIVQRRWCTWWTIWHHLSVLRNLRRRRQVRDVLRSNLCAGLSTTDPAEWCRQMLADLGKLSEAIAGDTAITQPLNSPTQREAIAKAIERIAAEIRNGKHEAGSVNGANNRNGGN